MRDYHNMKKYIIDKSKNIGNVIFVVEGGRSETGGLELRLLKKIFVDILGYEVQELRRGSDEFICHGKISSFHVFALNLPKNQLTQLNEDSLDLLFQRLRDEFYLKPEDCPIFFLYDRDVLSYGRNEIRSPYVKKYTDPYGTSEGEQGQLLLSYPAIESYLLSCLKDDTVDLSCKLGKDAKILLSQEIYPDEAKDKTDIHQKMMEFIFPNNTFMAEERLIHSVNEMNKGLNKMGLFTYDLDNLSSTLLDVYDYEQKNYKDNDSFLLFSFVGMALLELGVIIEIDEDE